MFYHVAYSLPTFSWQEDKKQNKTKDLQTNSVKTYELWKIKKGFMLATVTKNSTFVCRYVVVQYVNTMFKPSASCLSHTDTT